ncbi:MAG: DUF1476 domain-containing protein [Rhizomicrobium sp.]
MSGGFDEREKAMEAKWAHDENLKFRALTRRNKLLAEWAAGDLGLKGKDVDLYQKAILDLEVRGADDDAIVDKLHADFSARGIAYSEHFLRRKMTELAVVATDQVMHETKA